MDHQFQVKLVTLNFGTTNIFSSGNIACKTGDIIGVFGRNGSGKSSLFKILFGTLKPDAIELYLDGKLWDGKSNLSTYFACHTQDVMLPKSLLSRDLIALYILNQDKQHKIYYSAGVHDMLNKRVGSLSLGQQRYLQFLLILNLDHPFILLDEPFSMVEPLYKDFIKEHIIAHRATKGFLITDHYYLDVIEIADQINLVKDGAIIPIADVEELKTLEYLSEQAILK